MSREIDFDKSLSDDDLQYLSQRPWLAEQAERQGYEGVKDLVKESVEVTDEGGTFVSVGSIAQNDVQDHPDNYEDMTNAELSAELERRDLPHSGTKAELVERLRESDAGTGE